MKNARRTVGVVTALGLTLVASGAVANDIPVIPKVKTRVSVKAIPIAPPLTFVDGENTFFGLTLPRETPPPCTDTGKASAKIVAAGGVLTATIKVANKPNLSAVVNQTVTISSRLHADGCTTDYVIPELTFSGAGQGLPPVTLVGGKATFIVTSTQIINANPGLFVVPRPLCPSDIFTIHHRLEINGCWYEAVFTIHHAG